jgi:hypothetical protein
VDGVANKLPGWKAILTREDDLSQSGTLSAIPIFTMMSLDIPVKTLIANEKIIKSFPRRM